MTATVGTRTAFETRLKAAWQSGPPARNVVVWMIRILNARSLNHAVGKDGIRDVLRQLVSRAQMVSGGNLVFQHSEDCFCVVSEDSSETLLANARLLYQELSTYPYHFGARTGLPEVSVLAIRHGCIERDQDLLAFFDWFAFLPEVGPGYDVIGSEHSLVSEWREQRGFAQLLSVGKWREQVKHIAVPIRSLNKGVPDLFEVRMKVRLRGALRSPRRLLDAARKTRHSSQIDLRTLDEAITCLRSAPSGGPFLVTNLALESILDPDFQLQALRRLNELESDRRRHLGFQIKEGFWYAEQVAVSNFFGKVTEMGVHLIVDSFGESFEGLHMIRKLPVFMVKFQREFVRQSRLNSRSEVLIRHFANMMAEVNCKTAFKESDLSDDIAYAREMRIDYVQGSSGGMMTTLEECAQRARNLR